MVFDRFSRTGRSVLRDSRDLLLARVWKREGRVHIAVRCGFNGGDVVVAVENFCMKWRDGMIAILLTKTK